MSQQPVTIDDIYALLRTSQEESRISHEEYDRQFATSKAESDRRIQVLEGRIAKLEEYIVDNYSPSSFIDKNDTWDVWLANNHEILAVMCFPEISLNDIDDFIENLQKFKLAFPAYKNYQAYGAVAGIEINDGVDRNAYQKGLFVIRPSGDTVEIVNDQKFKPKTW